MILTAPSPVRTAMLRDVVEFDRNAVQPDGIKPGVYYLGLEHLSGEGTILERVTLTEGDLASTKFRFTPEHVLYGKLRPYLNKVVRPDFAGVCSTDIIPLRPGPEVDRGYLYHWLRTPKIVELAKSRSSGANLPRISPTVMGEFEMPLPPLAEQRRIAAILDKADEVRHRITKLQRESETMLMSLFLALFGDPKANPRMWPVKKLGMALAARPQIGTIVPAIDEGANPVVRVGELGEPSILVEHCARVTLSGAELDRFALHAGDFLLARAIGSAEHLGKASIVPEVSAPAVFDSHVMRLRFKSACMHPMFFYFWLRTRGGRALFMEKAGRTAVQFNINSVQIQDIDVPLPPMARQTAFVDVAVKMQCTASRIKRQLVLCSLASAAFRSVALEKAL